MCRFENGVGSGVELEKTFDVSGTGSYVVTLDYIAIDSWDCEAGYVYVNDDLCWSNTCIRGNEGEEQCGTESENWTENAFQVSCNVIITVHT